MENIEKEKIFSLKKTVYGPVKSWRFGESLGIDPIYQISTCSFNCVYCQLGNIQNITNEKKIYVSTETVTNDYKEVLEKNIPIDVITYSGSGEPTLASNLSEMILKIKEITPLVPQYILTNATTLTDNKVRETLLLLDKVILKLDGGTEDIFQMVNRPYKGITLEKVVEGILEFQKKFQGKIEIQTMFMPMNKKEILEYANILKKINPDIVQLNTPKRPYPLEWHRENRGNHLGIHDHETRSLKILDPAEARIIEKELRELTQLDFVSIYR